MSPEVYTEGGGSVHPPDQSNQDIHLNGKSGYSPVWEISIFTYMGKQYIYLYGKSGSSFEYVFHICKRFN